MKSEFYVDEVSPPVARAGTFSSQTYASALTALLQTTKKCVKFRILAYCPGTWEILNFNSWVEGDQVGGGRWARARARARALKNV